MSLAIVYNGIIPARFLALLAHLSILVTLLSDKDEHGRICVLQFGNEEGNGVQNEYVLCLGLVMAFLIVELIGFVSGISMFATLHSLLSIICHIIAALIWTYSYVEDWDCSVPHYWWILIFCSTLPFSMEVIILVTFAFCRNGPINSVSFNSNHSY